MKNSVRRPSLLTMTRSLSEVAMERKRRKRRAKPVIKRSNYFISNEDKQQIYMMYMAGAKPLDIANELKMSDKTVYKYLNEMFCPPGGWRRGFIGSSEERSIRLAVENGDALTSVCSHFRRPMWMIWPIITRPRGIGGFVEVDQPEKIFTTHQYIERIGNDPAPSLAQRLKSFVRRVFGGA